MAFFLQSCQEMSLQSCAAARGQSVQRCKAVKTTSRPFKPLPVGFVILLFCFFFRKKHLSLLDLSHFWSQEMSLQLHEEEEVCRLQSRRPWDRRPSNSQACKLQAGTSPPWGAVSERNKMIAMVWFWDLVCDIHCSSPFFLLKNPIWGSLYIMIVFILHETFIWLKLSLYLSHQYCNSVSLILDFLLTTNWACQYHNSAHLTRPKNF